MIDIDSGSSTNAEQLNQMLGSDYWRLTPATFAMKHADIKWIPAPHLLHISSIVAHELVKGGARIIISVPPRHGKSEFISVNTPQWILDYNPASKVMLTGYGADLTKGFSRRVRDNILNKSSELNVHLNPDHLTVEDFSTTEGGGVIAAGVNGPITGKGTNVLIVDDYIKNHKEAASVTFRDSIYDWFISTAMTRLEPGGSVIVVATRWHVDDLIGRLLTMDSSEDWLYIQLEAVNTKQDDPMGRKIGEALWPERYNLKALRAVEALQGSYFWDALYQQNPTPPGAGIISSDDLIPAELNVDIKKLRLVRCWDLAASAEENRDWTVGALLGADDLTEMTYLLNVERFRVKASDVENKLRSVAESDGRGVPIVIEQEPGSAGKLVIANLQEHVLKGFRVEGQRPTGDKWVRAQPTIADMQSRKFKIQRDSWNGVYIDEWKMFPEGPHDDQVDATTGGHQWLWKKRYQGVTWGRANTDKVNLDNFTQDKSGLFIPKQPPLVDSSTISGVVWGRR